MNAPAARRSSFPSLGPALAPTLLLLLGACGRVGGDEPASASPRSTSVPLACVGAPSAPFVAIEDVADGSGRLGPCGDVMFAKIDGSVWRRDPTGTLESLATSGASGEFDATGELMWFRDGKNVVVRRLRSPDGAAKPGTDVVLEGGSLAFGTELKNGAARSFALQWDKDGLRRIDERGAGPALGVGVAVRGHAPLGTTVVGVRDGALVFVDVASGREAVAEGVSFHAGQTIDGSQREDRVTLSRDGRIALYERITARPCGDTSCADPNGVDIYATATGKKLGHAVAGLHAVVRFGTSDDLVDRVGAVVRKSPGAAVTPFSIDTERLTMAEHKDRSVTALLDDGRLVVTARSGRSIDVRAVHAGASAESHLVTINAPTSMIAAGGQRIVWAENGNCVQIPDSPSCQGAGQHGDLVVHDGTKELARHGGFTGVGAPTFLADGAAVAPATFFVGEPPKVAPMGTLALETGTVVVAADGSLTHLATPLFFGDTNGPVVELSSRYAATVGSTIDRAGRRWSLRLWDRTTNEVSELFGSNSMIEPLATRGESGPKTLAYVSAVEASGNGARRSVLWHGLP